MNKKKDKYLLGYLHLAFLLYIISYRKTIEEQDTCNQQVIGSCGSSATWHSLCM